MRLLLLLFYIISVSCGLEKTPSFLKDPHYFHYEELTDKLQNLTKQYPTLTKLTSIGKSVQGREMWALEVSEKVNARNLGEPMLKLVANMHGDEPVGRQLMVYLAEYFILEYPKNRRVKHILKNTHVVLVPSINPDGFEMSEEGRCRSLKNLVGRKNANMVDLNRDFPEHFKPQFDHGKRQPETLAVMNWLIANPFVLSANLHGGALVACYPFDDSPYNRTHGFDSPTPDDDLLVGRKNANMVDLNRDFPEHFKPQFEPETLAVMNWSMAKLPTYYGLAHGDDTNYLFPEINALYDYLTVNDSPTPDDKLFKKFAKTYSGAHKLMKTGTACGDNFTDGVTNGANWYELTGGMQDFNYLHTNCFEITLELSCCKYPNASTLPDYWELNKEPMLSFIELVHVGIKGVVRTTDGQPIEGARIVVQGIDHDVVTTSRGEFWRLLVPGKYEVHVTAPNYAPSKSFSVNVKSKKKLHTINFTLNKKSKNTRAVSFKSID